MALTQIPNGMLSPDLQASTYAMKNRIINGDMRIDQRLAGASQSITDTTNGHYTLDRWLCGGTQASKYSVQKNVNNVTPPTGFKNYLGVTSASAYSVVATDIFSIQQRLEGYTTADLMWGTSSAKAATLSFWVRSSLTGTFGGSIRAGGFDRALPFSYTINAANTWEYKTITFAGCTDGTWDTTNGSGGGVLFALAAGSNFQAVTGTWNTGAGLAPTGQTNLLGTNGATWYITGVQLEANSAATSFDYRPYGTELSLSQRYYEKINWPGTGLNGTYTEMYTRFYCGSVKFSQVKRANPTVTITSDTSYFANIGNYAVEAANNTGWTASSVRTDSVAIYKVRSAGNSAPNATSSYVWEGSIYLELNAEL